MCWDGFLRIWLCLPRAGAVLLIFIFHQSEFYGGILSSKFRPQLPSFTSNDFNFMKQDTTWRLNRWHFDRWRKKNQQNQWNLCNVKRQIFRKRNLMICKLMETFCELSWNDFFVCEKCFEFHKKSDINNVKQRSFNVKKPLANLIDI